MRSLGTRPSSRTRQRVAAGAKSVRPAPGGAPGEAGVERAEQALGRRFVALGVATPDRDPGLATRLPSDASVSALSIEALSNLRARLLARVLVGRTETIPFEEPTGDEHGERRQHADAPPCVRPASTRHLRGVSR